MTRTYTTITDLAQWLKETPDLAGFDTEVVVDAIGEHSNLFSNFGRIPAAELAALHEAVYTTLTGVAYPAEWAREFANAEEATQ